MAKPYALNRDWTLTPPAVLRPPLDYFSAAFRALFDSRRPSLSTTSPSTATRSYSPEVKRQVWTPMQIAPPGERFSVWGFGWFVWELRAARPMPWHYGYYTERRRRPCCLKVPDRQLTSDPARLLLTGRAHRSASAAAIRHASPFVNRLSWTRSGRR